MTRKISQNESTDNRSERLAIIIDFIGSVFERFAYVNINTSVNEDYDILKDSSLDFSDESCISYIDRASGKRLVLRPDFTPQICRTVTAYMSDNILPIRVSYKGNIFRSTSSSSAEKYQMGIEIFGGDEFSSDTEIILLADRSLKSVGLSGYSFAIGDMSFLQILLDMVDNKEQLIKIITDKQVFKLDSSFESDKTIAKEIKNIIKALPLSFGSIDSLRSFANICKFNDRLSSRLNYLMDLYANLINLGVSDSNIIFDLSEGRGLDYYTGMSFEIIHTLSGTSIGGGGRYDNLMKKFGKDLNAAGMAIKIDELLNFDILSDLKNSLDYLVVKDIKKAMELRDAGYSVLSVDTGDNIAELNSRYNFKKIFN